MEFQNLSRTVFAGLRRHWLLAALGAIVLGLFAYFHTPSSFRHPLMTELSPRLQPVFEKTKTVCFGRLVMDVPATATVVWGGARAPSDITRYKGDAARLDELVAHEEAKLRGEIFNPQGGLGNIYFRTINGARPNQRIVIGYQDSFRVDYKLLSFMAVGSDLYVQRGQAGSEKQGEPNPLRKEIDDLNTIARNLRPRADDELPTDPGVCIDGAFISDTPVLTHEGAQFGVRLAEFPDVHLSISTTRCTRVVESSNLEPRLRKAAEMVVLMGPAAVAEYARTRFLRKSARQLDGWGEGYEALAARPARDKGWAYHEFHNVTQCVPNDPLHPILDIQMDTGVQDNKAGATKASLTDEEAVAVWDRLTSTIRPRPTGVAARKTTDAGSHADPTLPLGITAASGDTCPHSGWWECPAASNIPDYERRQFLRKGDRVPKVMTVQKPGVWQTLRGQVPVEYVSTTWALVAGDAGTAAYRSY